MSQPPQDTPEFAASGSEDGIDGVASAMGEVLASHAMVLFGVSDAGSIAARRLSWRLISQLAVCMLA